MVGENKNIQAKTVLNYCLMEMAHRIGGVRTERPKINELIEYCDDELNGGFTLNLYEVESGERNMTYRQLSIMEDIFKDKHGNVDKNIKQIFYYGPGGSDLWASILGYPEGHVAVDNLAKILGISASQVRELSENHLKLLLREVPRCSFDVIAYSFLLIHDFLIGRKSLYRKDSSPSTIIDRLLIYGEAREYMYLLGLKTEDLYPLMYEKEWFKPKGKEKIEREAGYTLRIKDGYGDEYALGLYLLTKLDWIEGSYDSVLSSERLTKELQSADLIEKQLSEVA